MRITAVESLYWRNIPRVLGGTLPVPEGPGLGVKFHTEAFESPDLDCIVTVGKNLHNAGENWRCTLGFSHASPDNFQKRKIN